MKKVLIIILVFCFFNSFAQKNSIKGRAFVVPRVLYFTLGVGFERMINDNFSTQILFNRMGYDMRSTDGSAEFYNCLIPEVRYYFGKKENKKLFAGIFTEFSKSKTVSSGYPIEMGSNQKMYLGSSKNIIAPGFLLGINNGTKKKWLIEFYLGSKYKFRTETNRYRLNGETIFEKDKAKKIGLRVGINFGFRF